MQGLYRNRLIRAYLGASRYSRDPDRFTGFDENDNLQMFQLRRELVWNTNFADPKELADLLRQQHESDSAPPPNRPKSNVLPNALPDVYPEEEVKEKK